MRILHLPPCAASLHAGSVASEGTLARALAGLGHEVEWVPLFAPPRLDSARGLRIGPVHYGALNVLLQEHLPFFRWLPRFCDRVFDRGGILRFLSSALPEPLPAGLGRLTCSLLAGPEGRQRKELARLAGHLAKRPKPDLLSLGGAVLLGLAPTLRARLDVPVVCTVRDEDLAIEALPEPDRSCARRLMRRHAKEVELFLAPSRCLAAVMTELLAIPPRRMVVLPPGVETEVFRRPGPRHRTPFVVGSLAAISPAQGTDLLVEAFIALVERHEIPARLRLAGPILQPGTWQQIRERLSGAGLLDRLDYAGTPGLRGKVRFLHGLSVFVSASRRHEGRGLSVLEALAAGLPVAAPRSGAFGEIFDRVRGGFLYMPGDASGLAQLLADFAVGPDLADEMGRAAAESVALRFGAAAAAEQAAEFYGRASGRLPPAPISGKRTSTVRRKGIAIVEG